MILRAAGAMAVFLVPSLGAQTAALMTGGGVARLDQFTSQPISMVALSGSGSLGPVVLGAASSATNYRDLGNAHTVLGRLQLEGGRQGWRARGGPVLMMGNTVQSPWTTAWGGEVGVTRTLSNLQFELKAAEGVSGAEGQTVSFGQRGAAAGLELGRFTVRGGYDVTIIRDSTLRNNVFFDPGLDESSNFRDRVRQVRDASMHVGVSIRNARLEATVGRRSGDDIATQTFWRVDADLPVAQVASIVFRTSRDPADLILGLRGGRTTTLGFRVALQERRSEAVMLFDIPVDVRRQTPELVKVILTLPGGSRALIMAEFTDWQPKELKSLGNGRFEGWFRTKPGTYRINVAIDEGPWIAPPGMPRVGDGYGGVVGLLDL